jgi:hypothetical protein
MRERFALIARITLGMGQLVGIAYLTLVAWLVTSWMVDDGWASRASDADWWALGAQRAGIGLFVAALAGGVLLGINHLLLRWNLGYSWLRPAHVAWLGGAAIALASVIGAINFIVERPYM